MRTQVAIIGAGFVVLVTGTSQFNSRTVAVAIELCRRE